MSSMLRTALCMGFLALATGATHASLNPNLSAYSATRISRSDFAQAPAYQAPPANKAHHAATLTADQTHAAIVQAILPLVLFTTALVFSFAPLLVGQKPLPVATAGNAIIPE